MFPGLTTFSARPVMSQKLSFYYGLRSGLLGDVCLDVLVEE